ncbi:hypothetical protein AVEN_218684-1 [Araneus ventricosus]|uniref:Uncharacterized protein n=1 Tax=Araneus ventricosus TaxID=182803 RepID=A0A4Y2B669_ARAVE|nr:hypothetical protein AVEN_218684-1 [Araneus ventricosus]
MALLGQQRILVLQLGYSASKDNTRGSSIGTPGATASSGGPARERKKACEIHLVNILLDPLPLVKVKRHPLRNDNRQRNLWIVSPTKARRIVFSPSLSVRKLAYTCIDGERMPLASVSAVTCSVFQNNKKRRNGGF